RLVDLEAGEIDRARAERGRVVRRLDEAQEDRLVLEEVGLVADERLAIRREKAHALAVVAADEGRAAFAVRALLVVRASLVRDGDLHADAIPRRAVRIRLAGRVRELPAS